MRILKTRALAFATLIACSGSGRSDVPVPSAPAAGRWDADTTPPTAGVPAAVSGGSGAGAGSPVVATSAGASGGSGQPGAGVGSAGMPVSAGASGSSGQPSAAAGAAPDEQPPQADCFGQVHEATSGGTTTAYPGGRWSVPEPTYGTVIETNIEIAMSDGVVLVGDVSYPTERATRQRASGTFPVILTQNPYGAAAFGAQYGEIFVTHGYIFASVDVRGTSRSGGMQDLFSPRAAMDGAELVSWVAKLEGSDGRVGLQGCSQLGINQLETASLLGPGSPVKAMIPACPSGDFYRDTAFDNGVPSVTAGFLVPDAAMGADTAYYREYWKARDRVARAPAIARADIPMLLWSGWHEPGALGSFDLYTVLQNVAAGRPAGAPISTGQEVSGKYQVIIGDWGHGGGLDLGIELQFFDTWIKGVDTGLSKDTKTPLHLAELGGTKRWINARCYPLVKRYTPLFLSSGRKLSKSADSEAGHEEIRWVPQATRSTGIEYTSEPFAAGAMLAGPMAARLQVTSSNTNLQLFVEVFDRSPGGALSKVGSGSVLGSLRRTDQEKSWMDESGLPARPFLTLDQDHPMTPGERTQLDVPLGPTLRSIEPMHSIVVRVSAHPPDEQCLGVIVPPVGCYPTEPMLAALRGGVYELLRGGEVGSLVSLPLLERGTFPSIKAAASPTGTRDYPLPIDW